MRSILTLTCISIRLFGFGQSNSTHYKSNIRGSLTSGNISSTSNLKTATVSIWTEGHEQNSNNYTNSTVATENKKQTSGIKRLTINDIKLNIYPNPSNDLFKISTDLADIEVVVHDVTGKEIFSQSSTDPISSFFCGNKACI
ncbi:MAG: hypothetical protein ACI8SE_001057 [Bacteroidia bacterium]|jgi:hypothetical protein